MRKSALVIRSKAAAGERRDHSRHFAITVNNKDIAMSVRVEDLCSDDVISQKWHQKGPIL